MNELDKYTAMTTAAAAAETASRAMVALSREVDDPQHRAIAAEASRLHRLSSDLCVRAAQLAAAEGWQ